MDPSAATGTMTWLGTPVSPPAKFTLDASGRGWSHGHAVK